MFPSAPDPGISGPDIRDTVQCIVLARKHTISATEYTQTQSAASKLRKARRPSRAEGSTEQNSRTSKTQKKGPGSSEEVRSHLPSAPHPAPAPPTAGGRPRQGSPRPVHLHVEGHPRPAPTATTVAAEEPVRCHAGGRPRPGRPSKTARGRPRRCAAAPGAPSSGPVCCRA